MAITSICLFTTGEAQAENILADQTAAPLPPPLAEKNTSAGHEGALPSVETAPLEPQVTIVERNGNREEEYRINGRLYMIKVTPAGSQTPYYLIDNKGTGDWERRDSLDSGLHVPMWVIFQF